MLYLHCGWPRTSTTNLQDALFAHGEDLAAAGLVYPERWTFGGASHHGLAELFNRSPGAERSLDDLKRLLSDCAGRGVVLSVEGFTFSILAKKPRDALLTILDAVSEVSPITCMWSLRRFDELLASLYLLRLQLGFDLPEPEVFFRQTRLEDDLFRGMQAVDDALEGSALYVRYSSDGAHNRQLMEAMGVPEDLLGDIEQQLQRHRLNPSLSRKQAAICLNLDVFSSRAGVELSRAALRKAVYRGELSFEEDGPCELLGGDSRRALLERALAAAKASRFTPYVDFFAGVEVRDCSPVSLDPSIVTDLDLKLVSATLANV